MPIRFKTLGVGTLSAGLLAVSIGDAYAACTRRVYNRSALVLVASQEGGPTFVLKPRASTAIRLSQRGTVTLAAYCRPLARGAAPGGLDEPVARVQLGYEAVLDKCFIEFGTNVFQSELGRGFIGMNGTAPFTVNNPRQGDIVLGPFTPQCSL